MIQKSYDNEVALYLIPTPIGNLDDITLRAIKTLESVDVIFAEDTRETRKLLNYLKISKKIISNHDYNEKSNCEKLLSFLNKGHAVGLVSDRGTPIINDPGYNLVKVAIKNNYNVIALPGPTALIPALIASGLEPLPFLFYGFLNKKENLKIKELEKLKYLEYTIIFYESSHRLLLTLENILKVFGNRKISISREISKRFEEIYRGETKEIIKILNNVKGEMVIVVEKNKKETKYDNLSIIEHINLYLKEGLDTKEAIKKVAKERRISKNEVYKVYHEID